VGLRVVRQRPCHSSLLIGNWLIILGGLLDVLGSRLPWSGESQVGLAHLVEVEPDLARVEIFVNVVLTSSGSGGHLDLIFLSPLTSSLVVPLFFVWKLLLNNEAFFLFVFFLVTFIIHLIG